MIDIQDLAFCYKGSFATRVQMPLRYMTSRFKFQTAPLWGSQEQQDRARLRLLALSMESSLIATKAIFTVRYVFAASTRCRRG